MNLSTEQMELIEQILFPHAREQRTRILEAKGHFVHYTTADGAEGILKNRSVWLRSTTCRNDYTEVLHGYIRLALSSSRLTAASLVLGAVLHYFGSTRHTFRRDA